MKKSTFMKNQSKKITFFALLMATLSSMSCSDNNASPVNEEEVISTVTVRLTGGGQVVTLTSKDLDGDGPNAPVVTVSGNLAANTSYTGTVEFLNETVNPAVNLTSEIQVEGVDHQIFYQPTSGLGAFTYTDTDANGKPIGLTFNLLTSNATSGMLNVTLRHLPLKSAAGVSSGDITNAGGSTDAQVQYPIVVN
jgi:hypothetical protein